MKTICLLFILLGFQSFSQEKKYLLISRTEHADLNYKLFGQFGSVKIYSGDKIQKAFSPRKGKFTVCVFEAAYMGDSFDGTTKLFHDRLILKVDPETGEIRDGFHYTMEWAEPPALSDLYRVTDASILLSDQLNLDQLNMQLDDAYQGEIRDFLEDHGILYLK